MANLTEVSQWESVIRQIENGEAATGGADGLANVQAKQLANRTQWLKENYLPLIGGALAGNSLTWNGNDLAGSAIVAKSLGDNGYVKYASGLIIQWGKIINDGSTSGTTNLNLSMPWYTVGVKYDTPANDGSVTAYPINDDSFHWERGTGIYTICWFAIGNKRGE